METPETRAKLDEAIKTLQSQNKTAEINQLVSAYKQKYNPTQKAPTIEQQKQTRVEQGLPVSVRKDRIEPTALGGMVRGIAKLPARISATLNQPIQAIKAGAQLIGDNSLEGRQRVEDTLNRSNQGFQTKYLGQVDPLGYKDGRELSFGETLLDTAGAGLEAASYLPFGRAIKGVGQLAKAGFQSGIRQVGKSALPVAIEGGVGGSLSGAGTSMQEGGTFGQIAGSTALGGLIGFGSGGILGGGANVIGRKLGERLIPEVAERSLRARIGEKLNKAIGLKGKKSTGAFVSETSPDAKRIQALEILNREAPNIEIINSDGIVDVFNPSDATYSTTVQALSKAKSSIYNRAQSILKKNGQNLPLNKEPSVKFLESIINSEEYDEIAKNFARRKLNEVNGITNIVSADGYISNSLSPFVGQAMDGKGKIQAKIATDLAKSMKENIDITLETVSDAPLFRELYSDYSSLKAIEDGLVQKAQMEARRLGGGLADYVDVFSVPEIFTGIITANPTLIFTGTARTVLNRLLKFYKNPERALRSAFKDADKLKVFPKPR